MRSRENIYLFFSQVVIIEWNLPDCLLSTWFIHTTYIVCYLIFCHRVSTYCLFTLFFAGVLLFSGWRGPEGLPPLLQEVEWRGAWTWHEVYVLPEHEGWPSGDEEHRGASGAGQLQLASAGHAVCPLPRKEGNNYEIEANYSNLFQFSLQFFHFCLENSKKYWSLIYF